MYRFQAALGGRHGPSSLPPGAFRPVIPQICLRYIRVKTALSYIRGQRLVIAPSQPGMVLRAPTLGLLVILIAATSAHNGEDHGAMDMDMASGAGAATVRAPACVVSKLDAAPIRMYRRRGRCLRPRLGLAAHAHQSLAARAAPSPRALGASRPPPTPPPDHPAPICPGGPRAPQLHRL
jgi:hypothetical protein